MMRFLMEQLPAIQDNSHVLFESRSRTLARVKKAWNNQYEPPTA